MSMAKKIYAIVLLLLVVAVVILCIGIYGIRTVTSTMHALILQSKRVSDMDNVDKITLERRIATVDIIQSLSEVEMKRMIDKDFAKLEDDMDKMLDDYVANFDQPPPASQIQNEKDVRALWNDYVKVTNEVAALSYRNTNNKAMQLNYSLTPFWDSVDKDLSEVSVRLVDGKGDPALLNDLSNARAGILRFRVLMMRYIPEQDDALADGYLKSIHDTMNVLDGAMGRLSEQVPPALGQDIIQRIGGTLLAEAQPKIKQIIDLAEEDTNNMAIEMLATRGTPIRDKLYARTDEIILAGTQFMTQSIAEADRISRAMLIFMIAAGAIGIVLASIVAYLITRALVRGLNSIIAGLGDSSTQVNAAAGQISSSSQNLAEGSTEQAASLEETSSALEEMASMTRQNADNANKTNTTTQNNNNLIATGAVAVKNMSSAMADISDSAEQINRIIKTIEDIAFQTNLLALNAAVEAARAGEAGKGFAVVADEVRNLAGRSAQAARDTTHLISTTIERVRNGSEIADELDSSFKEIEEGSQSIARLVSEITAATNEQAQGVDQVNTAVAQMDKVTQSNAATAEEAASAAEELSAQASALNGMVGDLISMVEGRAGGNAGGGQQIEYRAQKPRISHAAPKRALPMRNSGGGENRMKMLQVNEVIPLDEDSGF